MKGVLALVLVLAQSPAVAPSPQPSPLKQIIDIKVRGLCATLGSSIQIALVGLMKNDQVIETGRRGFVKLAWDQARGSKALEVDRLVLKNAVAAMVHNLYAIDQVLDDPARFPSNPVTEQERTADAMKAALLAVEERQKVQLNILNGTVETEALSSMQHDLPDFTPTSNQPNQPSVPTAAPAGITDAGLQQPKPAATAVPLTFAGTPNSGSDAHPGHSTIDYGVASTSTNATFATAMANVQAGSAALETRASAVIIPVAQECRLPAPEGSPSP
ncbi:MAG: hypothetical protein WB615_10345 [Candidatus Tumulicola sp.]